MFDGAKNAKIIGYLLFIFSLIDLVSMFGSASEYTMSAVVLSLIGSIGSLIVAYGLIKTKIWSIYGIGMLALYRIVLIFYNNSVGSSASLGVLFMLGVNIILFFWFLSAKKNFKK